MELAKFQSEQARIKNEKAVRAYQEEQVNALKT